MKKIAIHQPNFLPWMGYFEKARRVDEFVFLDHVPFSKGSYTNRVRYFCKSSLEIKWLTIPVKNSPLGTPINQIELSQTKDWESKIIHTIKQNMDSTVTSEIVDKIQNRTTEKLVDLNISLIEILMRHLEVSVKCLKSSEMNLPHSSEQEVLKISELLDASHYISGKGGENYLNNGAFAQRGIDVEILNFKDKVLSRGIMEEDEVSLSAVYALKV